MHHEPLTNTRNSQENVEGSQSGRRGGGASWKGRGRIHEQLCDYDLVIWKHYKGKTAFPGT